ncbi:MAG: sugar transferase [Alphaproteobacteria bacterium]|nr:sugar transferase [Alphaproteobacteria bacterium]
MNKNQETFIDLSTSGDFFAKYDYAIKQPIKWKIKRFIDVSNAFAGLVLLFPLLIACGIAIKKESDGPVIFKQERIGFHGKTFTLYKFRTMHINSDESPVINPKTDSRITNIGKFLRKYSIDELPQLVNILKGDMSLVGPRPIRSKLFTEIQSKNPDFQLRFATKPGLRLNIGRMDNGAFNQEIHTIERNYIENWSLKNDLSIFLSLVSDTIRGRNY